MDACSANAPAGCYCEVRESPVPAVYYTGVVPAIFLAAMWASSRRAARGATVTLGTVGILLSFPFVVSSVYANGVHIPLFAQTMAVVWPQWILFGPRVVRLRETHPI